MNQIIFVCLLSISLCLSAPTDPQGPHAVVADPTTPVPTAVPKVNTPLNTHNETTTQTKPAPTSNAVSPTAPTTPVKPVVDNKTDKKPEDKSAPVKQPDDIKPTTANKANDKPATPKEHEEKPAPPQKPTNSTEKPNGADKPGNKIDDKSTHKPEAATDKNATSSTTEPPKSDDKKEVVLQSRGFDGPSFFGGIILTLGMLAIGFIGFKYYRTQTERNYHTL